MQVAADVEEQARFGPYRLVRRVGSGGMGTVFEAEDMGLGHRVALKLLHPHVARRPGAVERFLREGRSAARIRHPNVVQVFALGLEGETPYLAMELLRGDDLSQVIAREGRLSLDAALDLVLPVVAAVAAAHDAGVIHRDLKPSNVCITLGPNAQACPKVVDFGVSKVIAGDGVADVTASDSVVGTTAYMAPEQARAAGNASFRSDQYSLAALLYQCITGTLPFSGASVYEMVESIMTTPLGAPSARTTGIPPAIDALVLRAMSRNPEERFPSVRAFGAALLPLASERTRLALGVELERSADCPCTDAGHVVAKDAPSSSPESDPTELLHTAVPTASQRGSKTTSSALGYAVWMGAAALVIGLASMAFGREASAPSTRPIVAVTATTAATIGPDPSPRGPEAMPQEVRQPSVASAAPSAVAQPPPQTRPPLPPRPQRPSSAPSVSAAPVTFGDNRAPILP
jgi:serine/threonine protein kinase